MSKHMHFCELHKLSYWRSLFENNYTSGVCLEGAQMDSKVCQCHVSRPFVHSSLCMFFLLHAECKDLVLVQHLGSVSVFLCTGEDGSCTDGFEGLQVPCVTTLSPLFLMHVLPLA